MFCAQPCAPVAPGSLVTSSSPSLAVWALIRDDRATGAPIYRRGCVSGDRFEPAEVEDLLRHLLPAPMLRDLVLNNRRGVLGFAFSDSSSLIAPHGVC